VSGAALLVVRPEKICVRADDGPVDGNECRGVVTEVTYVGDVTRYRIQLDAEVIVTAKLHNRRGTFRAEHGARVCVGWDPDDARVLRAPEPVPGRREETLR
jgi:ABC-type Fe3+/spermidine/putrescine transport system ATPase subunit